MPNLTQNEPVYEENSHEYLEVRAVSQLGASTSAPIFRESLIQDLNHNELSPSARSPWWDRSGPQGGHAQTSFFEPPDFNQQAAFGYHDKYSDRGSEDQDHEQRFYWRDYNKLSRTACTDDDLEAGEFKLHFDDIYSRPPDTPTVNVQTFE
uniref:Uncharacterized protein n=2 Tax=Lotus japonicus TaxID=34305 RepID=I3SUP0_LOTJA|nr:unknown [Lotus japonicus]